MSLNARSRVWKLSKHTASDKLLFLALAEDANDEATCSLHYDTLAEMTGVNRRSAIRIVEKLSESGELLYKPIPGRGNANLYFIVIGLTTGEVEQTLISRFEMTPEDARITAESLLKKGVIYDIKGVTCNTISGQEKGVTGGKKVLSVAKKVLPVTQKGVTGNTPLMMININDENDDEIDKDSSLKQSAVLELYHNNIRISEPPITLQEIISPDYLDLPLTWWRQAIKIASDNSVYKWSYIRAILDLSKQVNLEPAKVSKDTWTKGKYDYKPKHSAKQSDEGAFTFETPPDLPEPPALSPEQVIWQQVLADSPQIPKWLAAEITPIPRANGTFKLAVSNDNAKQWIDNRLMKVIKPTLNRIDDSIKEIEVIIQ